MTQHGQKASDIEITPTPTAFKKRKKTSVEEPSEQGEYNMRQNLIVRETDGS